MLRRRREILTAILSLSLCIGGGAQADPNTDMSRYLGQHGYCVAEVDNGEKNREFVEAKVNGRELKFFVDTGWERTTLTAAAARHLGLDVHDTGKQDVGVGGIVRGNMGIALINRFQLSNFDINRTNTILVLPKETDGGWPMAHSVSIFFISTPHFCR